MSFVKYLLPALAATQLAFASDSCGDTTVSSQSDADALNSCTTVDGDIKIKSSFSGTLTLNGIQKISGSLTGSNCTALTSIIAPSLVTITDSFTLNEATLLTELSFAELTSVGAINWEALPALQSLTFPSGVTDAGDVVITNTGLTSLNGISLETVGKFQITDNTNLRTININNLKNATDLVNFAGNWNKLEIEFPNLASAYNMTFRNISSVSMPSLEKLKGQLGFWGTEFKSFSAPNLTTTADLTFNDNSALTNISMPVLKTVKGGFVVSRNDKLADIDLPELETVTGAIDFSGTFDTLNMGALQEVDGGFNVQSTNGTFACTTFKKMQSDGVIRGTYNCKATTPDPTTSNGKSGTTSSTSSSGTTATSSGAASSLAIPATGVAAFFLAFAQFL
ncbi:uncharacterized protein N7477_008180 [Penicillium maclennaniae]|uniref:uncharacterized protein n=1 Tax=Penicillium maclennaniae TaxID=1343394 RepID=UPI0025417FC8|nr:uncharacterized protein N7477_008180 [Penicillium maclennaniae]KAJ5665732.1 hypothetical protein N7477_008180 [Penicillium maclennaniae]